MPPAPAWRVAIFNAGRSATLFICLGFPWGTIKPCCRMAQCTNTTLLVAKRVCTACVFQAVGLVLTLSTCKPVATAPWFSNTSSPLRLPSNCMANPQPDSRIAHSKSGSWLPASTFNRAVLLLSDKNSPVRIQCISSAFGNSSLPVAFTQGISCALTKSYNLRSLMRNSSATSLVVKNSVVSKPEFMRCGFLPVSSSQFHQAQARGWYPLNVEGHRSSDTGKAPTTV